MCRKVYERFFAPEEGDIVVDVGAHIGTFSVRSARLVEPTGVVIAFEPNLESFYLLRKNIAINRTRNILPVNSALGKELGCGYLRVPTLHSGDAQLTDNPSVNSKLVDIMSLDVYLEREGKIPRVDFLKIDVEGKELEVLEGAEKTITKNRMRIVIEVHSQKLLFGVRSYLKNRGYRIFYVSPGSIPFLLYAINRSNDLCPHANALFE